MRFLGREFSLSDTKTRLAQRDPDTLRRVAIFAAVVAAVACAIVFRDAFISRQAGYGAVGLIVLVGSAGLVIPVPALAVTCTTSTFLNPAAVAVIAGIAGTVGELTGYFLGHSGRGLIDQSRFYQKVEYWVRKRGWLLLFVISAVPNPVFDVAGIAAGALRYPLWRFMLAVGLGKQVKFFMIAYACHYSLQGLKGVFGL